MSRFLQHLGSHLLCAVDTETTGTKPGLHEIIQIAIIPLDHDLKPDANRFPFILDMRPERIDDIDYEAMRVNRRTLSELMISAVDKYRAQDLFLEWFERQKLATYKRIIPVASNWPFDRSFIMDWLGPETYELTFSSHYRDTMILAAFMNDRASWRAEPTQFHHCDLSSLCQKFGIDRGAAHDAAADAVATAEVYKHLIQGFYP